MAGRHLIEYAAPVRDSILSAYNIRQRNEDGLISFAFEQSLNLTGNSNKEVNDWPAINLASDCLFVAVVTGRYESRQLLKHVYIPKFSPTCFNLTASSMPNQFPFANSETLAVTMTIDAQFTSQLKNFSSTEFIELETSLEQYVRIQLFKKIKINPEEFFNSFLLQKKFPFYFFIYLFLFKELKICPLNMP